MKACLSLNLFTLALTMLKEAVTRDDIANTLFLIKSCNLNNVDIIDENAVLYHNEIFEYIYVSYSKHQIYSFFLLKLNLFQENATLTNDSLCKIIEDCNDILYDSMNCKLKTK